MKPWHLIILLLMNFFWAAVYSAYKILGPDVPSGSIVTLRFGMAGVCLLALWPWLPGHAPRGKDLLITCLMGVLLYVLGQRLQVYGNEIGTAGNSAILMALEPLITSVAAGVFLREHIGPRRIAGFGLGLLGVAILHGVWRSDFRFISLSASLIFVSSFVCEAGYSVLGKSIVMRASVMKMLGISIAVGTGMNLLIDGRRTFEAAAHLSSQGWWLLSALAIICTVVGYTVWFVVIRECPINVAALTIFAQSIFGAALAAFWVGEKLHWGHLAGSLIIAAGLLLGLSRQIKSPTVAASTSGGARIKRE